MLYLDSTPWIMCPVYILDGNHFNYCSSHQSSSIAQTKTINDHIFNYTVIILTTLLFILLGSFVLFTCFYMNERSWLLNLSTVLFLGYASHQKGFLCYDPSANSIHISQNVIFLEHQYFFQHQVTPISSHSNSYSCFLWSPSVNRFKAGFVYAHQGHPLLKKTLTKKLGKIKEKEERIKISENA